MKDINKNKINIRLKIAMITYRRTKIFKDEKTQAVFREQLESLAKKSGSVVLSCCFGLKEIDEESISMRESVVVFTLEIKQIFNIASLMHELRTKSDARIKEKCPNISKSSRIWTRKLYVANEELFSEKDAKEFLGRKNERV